MKEFLFYKPEASGVDWKRIDSLRHVMEKRTASICSQRALLYTESFQSSEHEPYIIRKAKAFAHTLAHMDIYIQKHSLIFGNQASANFAAPIFRNIPYNGSLTSWIPLISEVGMCFKLMKQSSRIYAASRRTGFITHMRMRSMHG